MSTKEIVYYTYILQCADDTLYCGWTADLEHRLAAHNGLVKGGAKYTRGRRPVRLVYYEYFQQKQAAQRREYAIKRLTRKEKLKLIVSTNNSANVGRI